MLCLARAAMPSRLDLRQRRPQAHLAGLGELMIIPRQWRSMPGAGTGIAEWPGAQPASRQQAAYRCARGHAFTVALAAGIEPPAPWGCRCGPSAASWQHRSRPRTDRARPVLGRATAAPYTRRARAAASRAPGRHGAAAGPSRALCGLTRELQPVPAWRRVSSACRQASPGLGRCSRKRIAYLATACRLGYYRTYPACEESALGAFQLSISQPLSVSRNLLLVFNCKCRLRADTGISRRRRPRCPGVTPEGAAHGARTASQYPAEAVTAGGGFPGPVTLARGVPTRSGGTMSAAHVRRRMAGLEWGASRDPSCC